QAANLLASSGGQGTGPGGKALGEWLQDLRQQNARLGRVAGAEKPPAGEAGGTPAVFYLPERGLPSYWYSSDPGRAPGVAVGPRAGAGRGRGRRGGGPLARVRLGDRTAPDRPGGDLGGGLPAAGAALAVVAAARAGRAPGLAGHTGVRPEPDRGGVDPGRGVR